MVQSATLGFVQSAIVRPFIKTISIVNFLFEKCGLFVRVPKFECYWILVCLCMCCCLRVHMCVYVCLCNGMHLYIFPLSVGGKEWNKGRECEKRKVGEGGGNGLLQPVYIYIYIYIYIYMYSIRNGYCRRKWTRWHEFKSCLRLIAV